MEDTCRNCEGWEYADLEHEREEYQYDRARLDAYIIDNLYDTYERDMKEEKKEEKRMFSKLELKLFDVAYDALRVRVPTFDRLGKTGYYDAAAGIEKFVEIEFIDGVIQSGLSYSKKGVGERDCDVIVEGNGVELRCIYEKGVKGHLLKAFKDHQALSLLDSATTII